MNIVAIYYSPRLNLACAILPNGGVAWVHDASLSIVQAIVCAFISEGFCVTFKQA